MHACARARTPRRTHNFNPRIQGAHAAHARNAHAHARVHAHAHARNARAHTHNSPNPHTQGTSRIRHALDIMHETEGTALEITEELGRNREKIESTHARAHQVGDLTGHARRIIHSMTKREVQQKMMLWGVAVVRGVDPGVENFELLQPHLSNRPDHRPLSPASNCRSWLESLASSSG